MKLMTALRRAGTSASVRVASVPGSSWRATMKSDLTRRPSMTAATDRKSTRLNSSHRSISYAVFCLKKNGEEKRHRRAHLGRNKEGADPPRVRRAGRADRPNRHFFFYSARARHLMALLPLPLLFA